LSESLRHSATIFAIEWTPPCPSASAIGFLSALDLSVSVVRSFRFGSFDLSVSVVQLDLCAQFTSAAGARGFGIRGEGFRQQGRLGFAARLTKLLQTSHRV
jgi:hypothetical protein